MNLNDIDGRLAAQALEHMADELQSRLDEARTSRLLQSATWQQEGRFQ